jgi:D-alanyl-D-alanine carboxypeptidase
MAQYATMTRRGVLAFGLGSVAAMAVGASPATDAAGLSALDTLAGAALASRVAPGIGISVMKDATLIYSKGFGLANIETHTPFTPRSVCRIGSLAKQFTGASFLLLAEAGLLRLDDPLSRFFPSFPRAGEITLRQMLTHMSGLGDYTDTGDERAMMQNGRMDRESAALLELMRGTDPMFVFEPGTGWAYSNTAYVLLGLVIEQVTGQPYGQFQNERLFRPLGLARTAVDDASEIVPDRAAGYSPEAGRPLGLVNAPYLSMTFPGAGGAMRSTTEDLCRWHDQLLHGSLLRPESLRTMLTPGRTTSGELPTRPGADAAAPRVPVQYGFGLYSGATSGRRFLTHAGGIPGFTSTLRSYPDDRVTLAMIVNSDGGSEGNVGRFMNEVRQAVEQAVFPRL